MQNNVFFRLWLGERGVPACTLILSVWQVLQSVGFPARGRSRVLAPDIVIIRYAAACSCG